MRHVYPFFLPGAQTILFMITTDSGTEVAVLDIKKGSYRVLASNGANPKYVRTGYLTYVRSGAMLAVPFDSKRAVVTGSETQVINGVGAIVGGNYGEYSFSDNGILVYMAGQGGPGGKSVLGWIDRKGVTQRISDPQSWGNGRLSPDGLQVANSINAVGPSVDIWSFDVQRHILTRLTFGGNNTDPVWTPDGRHIAYYGASSGNRGIYWIAADGSGKPELLATIESSSVPCSFAPDGKTLVFSQPGTDKVSHLWTLPISGDVGKRKPALLHDTSFSESEAQISPDGRYVAYASQESGASEVYVQPFPGPGAKTRISTQGGVAPRWSRNGRELFYWNAGRIGLQAVDVQTGNSFRAGLPRDVVRTFSGTTWDIAPDGNRFLVELFPSGNTLRLETVVNWFDDLRRRVPAAK